MSPSHPGVAASGSATASTYRTPSSPIFRIFHAFPRTMKLYPVRARSIMNSSPRTPTGFWVAMSIATYRRSSQIDQEINHPIERVAREVRVRVRPADEVPDRLDGGATPGIEDAPHDLMVEDVPGVAVDLQRLEVPLPR